MRLAYWTLVFVIECCVAEVPALAPVRPCSQPRIDQPNFITDCKVDFHSTPYICDLSNIVSQTEARVMAKQLEGRLAFCRCTHGGRSCQRIMIGPGGGLNASQHFTIGISISHEAYVPKTLDSLMVKGCRTYPYYLHVEDVNFLEKFGRHYAQELRNERWSTAECQTDLTIFAIGSFSRVNPRRRAPTFFIDYAPELGIFMTNQAHEHLDGLAELVDEQSGLSPAQKVQLFLTKFLDVLEATHRVEANKAIPSWAIITFCVCVALSLVAVAAGHLVADDRSGRRGAFKIASRNSRKWKAGFSGGMWAS